MTSISSRATSNQVSLPSLPLAGQDLFSAHLQLLTRTHHRQPIAFALALVALPRKRGIATAANALSNSLRTADVLGRIDGDTFGVLLLGVKDEAGALAAGRKIHSALQSVNINALVGCVLFPQHASEPTSLLAQARAALSKANATRLPVVVAAPARVELDTPTYAVELAEAIDKGQITLFYQPKMDFKNQAITGVEALARWVHPTRGIISPLEFIPLAERSGLIKPLSARLLDQALAQAAKWQAKRTPLKVAVNLSMQVLEDPALAGNVAALLERYGLAPDVLEIEITESDAMADPTRTKTTLDALHELGVKLSIDDYGSGYASLGYLKEMPVSTLKIDKSFIESLCTDDECAIIVGSTIDLAHDLKLDVVAEGVEDEATWKKLRELGCDLAQGFLFTQPLPARDLARWLASRQRATSMAW